MANWMLSLRSIVMQYVKLIWAYRELQIKHYKLQKEHIKLSKRMIKFAHTIKDYYKGNVPQRLCDMVAIGELEIDANLEPSNAER